MSDESYTRHLSPSEHIRLRQWCFEQARNGRNLCGPGQTRDLIDRSREVEEYVLGSVSVLPLQVGLPRGRSSPDIPGSTGISRVGAVNGVTSLSDKAKQPGTVGSTDLSERDTFIRGDFLDDLPDEPLTGEIFVSHSESSPDCLDTNRMTIGGDAVTASPPPTDPTEEQRGIADIEMLLDKAFSDKDPSQRMVNLIKLRDDLSHDAQAFRLFVSGLMCHAAGGITWGQRDLGDAA